jgi:acyl carrier protein
MQMDVGTAVEPDIAVAAEADLGPSAAIRVLRLVQQLMADRAIVGKLDPEVELRDVGLDSMDIVRLVLAVESEFACTIPDNRITPANFRTVSSVCALVSELSA